MDAVRTSRVVRLGLLAWISTLVACSEYDGPPRRNIVLVTIDTLRSDHLSCYGYPRNTSPFLDSMASAGARFTNATAACSHTGPAHASIFTGLSPIRHRLILNGQGIRSELDTMAELLEDVGYETIGITAVGFLSGLQSGFDDFLRGTSPVASGVIESAIDRLNEREVPAEEPPLFLWLHFFDVHTPYRSGQTPYYRELIEAPREEHEQLVEHLVENEGVLPEFFENGAQQMVWLASNYDAEIRVVDEQLERFYGYMDETGHNDDTLWIFVADHGEALGDHMYHGHDQRLFQEQLSIPLILHATSSDAPPAKEIDQLVRHVDLLPTVLDWAEVPETPEGCEGVSLLPLVDGETETLPIDLAFSQRRSWEGKPDWVQEEVWALRVGPYKYIRHEKQPDELYDLNADPHESDNLTERETDVAERLHDLITGMVADWQEGGLAAPVVDGDGHLDELRELGYVDDE